MPASPNKHDKIHERILLSAGRLFNRHGYNAVSIDRVMAEAGLTRGSFYMYFSSKSDLYAQSVTRVVRKKEDAADGGDDSRFSANQIIRDYLSAQHFDDVDGCCPMIGLPSDISRIDPSVRRAFESALRLIVEIFEEDLRGRSKPAEGRGLAIAALCVGGMILARTVDDRALADELRSAALAAALSLGDWT
jgi:TetR/AcrR family transcriptional regulator, transcriptional repressor for nem operon